LATFKDKRTIGGNRVIADFSIKLSELDIANGRFNGKAIFNARGGMFFLGYGNDSDTYERIFRGCEIISIHEIEISNSGKRHGVLRNLKVKLIREKQVSEDYGLIVKFVEVTEDNLTKLNTLVKELPPAENDSVLYSEPQESTSKPVTLSEVWEFAKTK